MMKRLLLFAAILCGGAVMAQTDDFTQVIEMQRIVVSAVRASTTSPIAHTDVDKNAMKKNDFGQDLPFLLSMTPSVVATSDAGTGIGYTGVRIRGTDATRINVTTNGVPLNDAESNALYWVNTPDLMSSLGDVQVQRGVGTSTNGAGAFGGSISMSTESLSVDPYAEISLGAGSFGTFRRTAKLGSGLLGGHWVVEARLSKMNSDGYIERASADLKSYFLQTAYYNGGTMIKFITFAGDEQTYHAWNGVDADMMKTNRRFNSCGMINDADGNFTGKYYDNQIDKYTQKHYHLVFVQNISNALRANVTFHYTDGYGYYEEYKNARSLVEYGLDPFAYDGKTVAESNLVRRKVMDNGFGGVVFSLEYSAPKLSMTFGGGANRYDGDHYGQVRWIENHVGSLSTSHEYYRSNAVKDDANLYLKAEYRPVTKLSIHADLQARRIDYTIKGDNDKWDSNKNAAQKLDVDKVYNFFNPKAGITYIPNDNNRFYASLSVAHKEPTRNNFTDAKSGRSPKSESLYDYEAGYAYTSGRFAAGVNLYCMYYRDQLILTGEINEIGEPLADNVDRSYRAGVELIAAVRITDELRWQVNATLSRNRIKDYVDYVDTYDDMWNRTQTVEPLGDTDISFSPSFTAASLIEFEHAGVYAALQSNYVGEQYLNNSGNDDLKLGSYFVNNLRLSYSFNLKGMRGVTAGVSINNIFNESYASSGYGACAYEQGKRVNYIGYFPQATRNFMANLTLKF